MFYQLNIKIVIDRSAKCLFKRYKNGNRLMRQQVKIKKNLQRFILAYNYIKHAELLGMINIRTLRESLLY
jgi:hypothetical protein